MWLAWPREQVKPECDGIVRDKAADCAKAVDARQETSHKEKAGEPSRKNAEVALELLVGGSDVPVGKHYCKRTSEDAAGKACDLAA